MNMISVFRYLPSRIKVFLLRLLGAEVGTGVKLAFGAVILAKKIKLGKGVIIGVNSVIRAISIDISDNTVIGRDADIKVAGKLELGCNSTYGLNLKIYCRQVTIGELMHAGNDISLGYGSPSPDSVISIGKHGFLGHGTVINSEKMVEIGDDVGIGAEVMIWTHGSWLPVLAGFPATFAQVKIGDRVWLPARSIILPGTKIGNDVVVSTNSVVNGVIPDGSLIVGNPAKVIREKMYPKSYSLEKKIEIVKSILQEYSTFLIDKGFKLVEKKSTGSTDCLLQLSFECFYVFLCNNLEGVTPFLDKRSLILSFNGSQIDNNREATVFNLNSLTMMGKSDDLAEDLRDFLRRRGIKIFTDKKFSSIKPLSFRNLENK